MERNHVEKIRILYQEVLGLPMSLAVLRQVLTAICTGTPWQYYEYALEETALAPRPSWRYTSAIVNRLIRDQVPADRVRETSRKLPEQQYTQREYVNSDAILDAMMAEWLAKEGGENNDEPCM